MQNLPDKPVFAVCQFQQVIEKLVENSAAVRQVRVINMGARYAIQKILII